MVTENVQKSGLSKQQYLLNAVLDKQVISGIEINELKEISRKMAAQVNGLNALLIDLGEMTYEGEVYGSVPEKTEILKLTKQIKEFRKENIELWELLRLLIAAQNH